MILIPRLWTVKGWDGPGVPAVHGGAFVDAFSTGNIQYSKQSHSSMWQDASPAIMSAPSGLLD